ncbi:glycosyltransferase (plasmid) [Cupriavidus pinatubonensis]|uniref:glycosyltransferase n=1 Tax=Cupriavidus pinatubonensis TaxID=248026 RepID=UPI001C73514B|nr:glycosyltransferase [Cupriavidus pinatubonensis]QYY34185.1 glycosyltransferase [Cupriavidus pinatubonensis]
MIRAAFVVASISRKGGGVAEAVKLLAKAVKEHPRISVEVLTLKDEHFDTDIADWSGIKVTSFRYFGPSNYGFSPGLLIHMLRANFDLSHVHGLWMFHCFVILLWSKLRGKPYVVTPHGTMEHWIVARSPVKKWMVSKMYQTRFLKRASAFHILTKKERADVDSMVQNSASMVIPNFLPLATLTSEKPQWWEDGFQNKRIYLFFGRIHEKKGWRELCEAWDNLCRTDSGFATRSQLVFCGWLDGSEDFRMRVEALRLAHENACYAGPQFGGDKASSIQAATVFVLPSKSEGLPMGVLEAWAAGIPVLMTAACNLSIGFDEGVALEIGESSEEILAGLRIADSWSQDDIDRMSSASRNLIKERFSTDSVSSKVHDLYEHVLNDLRFT